jgi:hypothetical protein
MTHLLALTLPFLTGCAEPSGATPPDPAAEGALDTAAPLDDDLALRRVGAGPPRVRLGRRTDPAAAANYALLASAAITNVTGSSIERGNVGLSPAAASFITGFGLTADASNQFATSASVPAPGKVRAANFAPPTPSNLNRAVGVMRTAYTDAAGRSNPDFLNLNGGDVGGLTLAPGLYTWGTTVTVPNDVTFAGGPNDVWILQISNDLLVSANKRIILAGGARPGNIFWQVAGQVTVSAGAQVQGVILTQTAATLQTGATLRGRIYAQTQIALDDNRVLAP